MFALTILGNNSAIPAFGRNPTAQVLQTPDEQFLVDCGEGTQSQLTKYKVRRSRINRIFISHLHGDHYFGLIGLITSMGLLGRTQDLHIHGPAPLGQIIQLQLSVADTRLPYQLIFHPITGAGQIVDGPKITVHCFPVQHRIECWGFLFREKKKPRKLDPERAIAAGIPAAFYERLKAGEDYTTRNGELISNTMVTLPGTPGRSFAYCADTIFHEELIQFVRSVDLLYHETTYLANQSERAAARYHCTTVQAADIANKAGVKKLLIGHFSSRYESLDDFLLETAAVFPNTELAIEGVCYPV